VDAKGISVHQLEDPCRRLNAAGMGEATWFTLCTQGKEMQACFSFPNHSLTHQSWETIQVESVILF
jgi:hypothetical protein